MLAALVFTTFVLWSSTPVVDCFVPLIPINNVVVGTRWQLSRSSSTTSSLNAIGVFVRKAKEADVRKYCEEGPSPMVLSLLQQMKDSPNSSSSSSTDTNNNINSKLQSLLTKRKGTITIIAEYKRKLIGSGFLSEVPAPELLSPVFREFGASAIAVLADERTGGCTYTDITTFVTEQADAIDKVPGPVPIISNDIIVDEIQIAQAKEAGAVAITINYGLLGNENTVAQFIQDAKTLNMETIVVVSTPREAQSAVNAGATILCVSGNIIGAGPKYDVVSNITTSTSSSTSLSPICIIANILAQSNKSLEEVEEAWSCRDLGFHCVWVSDALYKSGNDPVEHPGAIIQSMRLKSSVQFASPKARSGKGDGAREYLGDILM